MRLVVVGRMRSGPERELYDRYAKRLKPGLTLVEIADSKGSADEVRRKDAAAILAHCACSHFVVALDEGGNTPGSEEFSALMTRWSLSGRTITFVIGGAEGLEASVIQRADATLSLGQMTWPHILARVMLIEQIYRAQTIQSGHPYHRSARPGV